jgi:hypothetical protein
MSNYPGWGWLLLCFAGPVAAQSELDPIIDQIREAAREAADPNALGAGYAAMVNFAVVPDISTATYHVNSDAADDPTLRVTRLPLRWTSAREQGARPFVQTNLVWQTLDTGFELVEPETVDANWTAYGVSLTAGLELPWGDDWKLIPAVDVGIVRMDSSADYDGPIGNALVKPALEGLVFDWHCYGRVFGASIAAEYRHTFGAFDTMVYASLTANDIDSYDSSSETVDFHDQVGTFDVGIEVVQSTDWSMASMPLALVWLAGGTWFVGNDRDVLGFERFAEAGVAVEGDLSQRGWRIRKLRLGATAIVGPDVTGWSVVLGYRF